jgi:hypothetical protein
MYLGFLINKAAKRNCRIGDPTKLWTSDTARATLRTNEEVLDDADACLKTVTTLIN